MIIVKPTKNDNFIHASEHKTSVSMCGKVAITTTWNIVAVQKDSCLLRLIGVRVRVTRDELVHRNSLKRHAETEPG